MRAIEKTIEYRKKMEEFYLVPIGCAHLGSASCDREKFIKIVKWVEKEEKAYWIDMGDKCEFINTDDKKRFDPEMIDPKYRIKDLANLPTVEANDYIKIVRSIAHKCIGSLSGNHEESVLKYSKNDIQSYICKELGIPNLGRASFIRLKFKLILEKDKLAEYTTFIVYAEHGHGGGRKAGGSVNALIDKAGYFEADIYLSGHDHKKFAKPSYYMTLPPQGLQLQRRIKLFVKTGSFFRTYEQDVTTYAEKCHYPPEAMGVVVIKIIPYTRDLHASV